MIDSSREGKEVLHCFRRALFYGMGLNGYIGFELGSAYDSIISRSSIPKERGYGALDKELIKAVYERESGEVFGDLLARLRKN